MVAVTKSHFWSWNWNRCLLNPQVEKAATGFGNMSPLQAVLRWPGREGCLPCGEEARLASGAGFRPGADRLDGSCLAHGDADLEEGGLGSVAAGRPLMCSCWARSTDLGILLGMALGNQDLEVWPLTQSKECALTGILRAKLQYRNRLLYMVTLWPPPWPPTQAPWLMGRRGLDLQGPSLDRCQP